MNGTDTALPGMSGRTLLAGALLGGVLLMLATGAWLLLRKPAAPASLHRRARTPVEILAAIPEAVGKSHTDAAIASARERARQTPGDALAWAALGDALGQKVRDTADPAFYEHAESAYRQALKLDPRSVDAMTGLAWVKGGRHLFDESTAWARQALAIDPGNAPAHGILGDAALELGSYDEALDEYQKMMDLRPDLSSWSRGAHLLWVIGDQRKAQWLMQKAIRAGAPYAENTAWCRAKLATMLFQDGALLPAEQTLAPALAAGSANVHVLLAAGRIATARHEADAAMNDYQRVLEAGPNLEALAALGDLHAAKGAAAEAEKYYAQVEALHAANLVAGVHDHMQIAKFYADHDRCLPEALSLAEQHRSTKNVFEADTLAWVYFKNGDVPRASEAIQRALSRGTPDAEFHFHAGLIADAAGDRVAAGKHLGQALSLNPAFSPLGAPLAVAKLAQLGGAAAP